MTKVTLTVKQDRYFQKSYPDLSGLAQDGLVVGYKILKIKNSTRWSIGKILSKQEIDDAIETLKVDVIIQ